MIKEYVYVTGKMKWPRLSVPDMKYNCWNCLFFPNKESLDKLLALKETKNGVAGVLNVISQDEAGDGYCVTLKRPVSIETKKGVMAFQPPVLLDGSKTLPDGTHPPFDREIMIGNGSDATIKLEVRQYNIRSGGKGRALRIESVRIDNLIPYERKDLSPGQEKLAAGLTAQVDPGF